MQKTNDFELRIIDNNSPVYERQTRNNARLLYRHPPFFITFISIFELFVFVFYALRIEEPISLTGPVPFKSKLIYNPYRRYEVWRYLTYTLIHAGYWHITFNLLIQLAVGVPLEVVHGFTPLFVIYFGGVIGGALGNSIADSHSYLAGASSGCYALIAAHLSNLILNWSEMKNPCIKLLALLTFTCTDFGTAVYERHFKVGKVAYRTSYGGHIAGALSGLLLGLAVLRNVRVHHWEEVVKRIALITFILSMVSKTTYCSLYSMIFRSQSNNHFATTAPIADICNRIQLLQFLLLSSSGQE